MDVRWPPFTADDTIASIRYATEDGVDEYRFLPGLYPDLWRTATWRRRINIPAS